MKREPKQIADEWLVLRSQEGSTAALEALLRKWHRPLWLRACRLTGDEEAARDVAQEALIAIARGIRRVKDPARFRSWAFQIASHKSRDWVRRTGRERHKLESARREQQSLPPGQTSGNGRQEQLQLVREGLAALPVARREILHLHYQLGFTLNEIAEAESIPLGTVKSRLHEARRQLRQQISNAQAAD